MIDVGGLRLDVSGTRSFLPPDELDALAPRVTEIAAELAAGTGPGSEYLGWLDLPTTIVPSMKAAAAPHAPSTHGPFCDTCSLPTR